MTKKYANDLNDVIYFFKRSLWIVIMDSKSMFILPLVILIHARAILSYLGIFNYTVGIIVTSTILN